MQAEQLIITLLLKRVAELEKENRYCPLTGVLNKRSLQQQLSKKFLGTVIAIDVVDFSGINNRLGHHQGDLVLKKIASEIKYTVGNSRVFRFGGDEFIILLDTESDADQITKNLCDCKYKMYIGVASGTRRIRKISSLIKQAFSQIESQKLKNVKYYRQP